MWRLEANGHARRQVTDVQGGVDAFAVSPVDGSVAFVSGNQLLLQDGDGLNRRVVADGNQVAPEVEDYVFRGVVSDPSFSPDGETLAYGFNGLHVYDIPSATDSHLLVNLGNLLGEPYVFAKEAYAPGPWSPDGSKLLILMAYFEGSTLAVMDPGAEEPFTRMWSDGPACCYHSWAADSGSVLVANPSYTGDLPGLWTYDAATGKKTTVVPGLSEDGALHYVGWPHQLPSGDLIFFHAELVKFSPDEGIPLAMARTHSGESGLTQVRPEQFRIREALWADDGSLVLVLRTSSDGVRDLLLVRPDATPLLVLIEQAEEVRHMAWGP